jgi:hypothetical protein
MAVLRRNTFASASCSCGKLWGDAVDLGESLRNLTIPITFLI